MDDLFRKTTEILLSAVRNGERKELLGGALSSVCGGCLADADYCARLSGVDPVRARFYVAAHYCAYVPFGEAGWDCFCGALAQKGSDAETFRFGKIAEALGFAGAELPAEYEAELKSFLGALYEEKRNFSSAAGCAAAVCSLYQACEAHFGKKGCGDISELAHRTSDVMEKFFKKFPSDGESAYAEAISEIALCPALSARQKKLLRKLTGER